jgi:HEPN domain-containing protein
MISPADLRLLARARLRDAVVLQRAGRTDAAVYLCGYALEVVLKARICQTLRWTGYTETPNEFRDLRSFQTHDLSLLLRLSGIEPRILRNHAREWNRVTIWTPEMRYRRIGSVTAHQAAAMISSARELLRRI